MYSFLFTGFGRFRWDGFPQSHHGGEVYGQQSFQGLFSLLVFWHYAFKIPFLCRDFYWVCFFRRTLVLQTDKWLYFKKASRYRLYLEWRWTLVDPWHFRIIPLSKNTDSFNKQNNCYQGNITSQHTTFWYWFTGDAEAAEGPGCWFLLGSWRSLQDHNCRTASRKQSSAYSGVFQKLWPGSHVAEHQNHEQQQKYQLHTWGHSS